jgi:hypothetical protein
MSEHARRRPLRSIDTPLGEFELLDGGVIFWTVAFGTVLDEATATEAYAAVRELASGGPVAIIGDARGLGFADRKARDLLASSQIDGRVGTGVIVGNPVVRFLAKQYARRVGSQRPFRVFDSETDAIEWGVRLVRNAGEG